MSAATIYGLCASGKLTHVRVSNAIRIPLEGIATYLAASAAE